MGSSSPTRDLYLIYNRLDNLLSLIQGHRQEHHLEAYCSVPIENCDDLKVKASVHWDDKKSCGARRHSARRAESVCVCVCVRERERLC